jgi:hypothetical protein
MVVGRTVNWPLHLLKQSRPWTATTAHTVEFFLVQRQTWGQHKCNSFITNNNACVGVCVCVCVCMCATDLNKIRKFIASFAASLLTAVQLLQSNHKSTCNPHCHRIASPRAICSDKNFFPIFLEWLLIGKKEKPSLKPIFRKWRLGVSVTELKHNWSLVLVVDESKMAASRFGLFVPS